MHRLMGFWGITSLKQIKELIYESKVALLAQICVRHWPFDCRKRELTKR
jgi:hypothetical protein